MKEKWKLSNHLIVLRVLMDLRRNNKVDIKAVSKAHTKQAYGKIGPKSFNVIKLLGTGSFGEVFLVEKRDSGKLYAMKVLKKDKIIGQNLTRYAITERNVMSVSNHQFIVSLQYAFQTKDRLFLVMEYCPGGDLSAYLEAEDYFSEDRARLYISEIILAIEDLHSRGIIFRDLKPDNIVLDQYGHCKLTDFGLSKEGIIEGDDKIARSFCGSYAYLAPEMIKKCGHNKNVDWYLLGVLLYEMLEGIPPFYDHDKDKLFKNILHNPVELPEELSEEAQDLLLRLLLHKDPSKRLGNKNGSKDIKKHPWFSKINWKDVENKKTTPPFPYLFKTKEEHLANLNMKNVKAIRQYNSYFKDLSEERESSVENRVPGWSFMKASQI